MSKKQKLKPLRGRLLIHPLRQATQSESGLVMPGNENRRETQGIVIGIGTGCTEDIELGDHVVYNAYSGDKISLASGGEYFTIHESHIVAVIQESEVVMFDKQTLLRLIDDRRGEMMQKYMDDIERTKITREVFESLRGRVEQFTREEGFEF